MSHVNNVALLSNVLCPIFILETFYLVQKVCRFLERLKVDYSDDLLVFLAQGYRLDLFLMCG